MISTRTPHAGSDLLQYTFTSSKMKFQPALPMRGSDVVHIRSYAVEEISTRTPHAGSDFAGEAPYMPNTISTRTPHAGSDMYDNRQMHVDKAFQPALPMRGVTAQRRARHRDIHISTRTPHAGSDHAGESGGAWWLISTRTPHAGSDRPACFRRRARFHFNPHSPCGE